MKRNSILYGLLLSVITLALTFCASAQEWQNTKINNDQSGQLQNEQQIVANPIDPLNQVAVWRDFRLGYRQVGYGYTFDGGRTWTNPGLFVDPHYPRDSDPALTVSAEGTFYAMLLAYTGDTNQPSGMLMYRSLDGGQSWTDRGFAVDGVQGVFEDKEFIACDRTSSQYHGKIYMAWARFYNADIYFVSTADEGDNWTSERLVSDSSGNQFPIPVVGVDGTVYVAWTSYYDSAIKIDRSYDGGLSFSNDLTVTNLYNPFPTINGSIDTPGHPAMDADITAGDYSGRLYVAYISRDGASDYDIFIRHSDNHGSNWSAPRRINDDPVNNGRDQFHPWLTVDNSGIVSVVWLDRRHDPSNLEWHCYISQSFDGGMTWTANQQISNMPSHPDQALTGLPKVDYKADRAQKIANGPDLPGWVRRSNANNKQAGPRPDQEERRAGKIGEYIGIASTDGFASVVWTDTRHGNQDTFGGVEENWLDVPESDGASNDLRLRLGPNPARGPVTLFYTIPEDGWVKLGLYDVGGRLVRSLVDRKIRHGEGQFTWDGTDQAGHRVSPGSYWVRLKAPGVNLSKSVRVN